MEQMHLILSQIHSPSHVMISTTLSTWIETLSVSPMDGGGPPDMMKAKGGMCLTMPATTTRSKVAPFYGQDTRLVLTFSGMHKYSIFFI